MTNKLHFKDSKNNKWLIIFLLIPVAIILLVWAFSYIQNLDFGTKSNILKSSSEIYQESMPAVVKVLEYSGWELYLPDYEYNENLDKFVPIPKSRNIIEDEEYGLEHILKSVEYGPTNYGSGFIISEDGYILTNAHVISNEEVWEENLRTELTLYDYQILEEAYYYGDMDIDTYNYYIYLNDYLYEYLEITPTINYEVVVDSDNPKKYTPELIKTKGGTSEDFEDWSLIKIDTNNLEYLELGNSNEVTQGSEIFVIGYPLVSEYEYSEKMEFKENINPTINKGIVSHIKYEGYIKTFQIDASASGGNSGGPVMNKKGEVIGILTAGVNEYDGGIYNYAQGISDILPSISDYFNS
jgi:serine protease Do